jgi:hypothetical protein
MSDRATGAGNFRVGRVFGRAFRMFGRHFPLVLLLTLIASAPRLLAYYGLYGSYAGMLQQNAVANGPYSMTAIWVRGLLVVLSTAWQWILLPALAQILLAPAAIQHWRRRPVRLGETLRIALVRLMPALGVTILVALVIMAGFIMIVITAASIVRSSIILGIVAWLVAVIAGLFIDCVFFAAVAACVIERIGPIKSLLRSADLTKGHRWRVFGIVLIFTLVLTRVGILGVALTFPLFPYAGSLTLTLGLFAVGTLIAAVQALITIAAYHDLRFAREGVDADEIAAVFD